MRFSKKVRKVLCMAAGAVLAAGLLLSGCAEKPQEEAQTPEAVCHLGISCGSLTKNPELLKEEKRGLIPEGGMLFDGDVTFTEGETVLDILERVTRENKIHMDSAKSAAYNVVYVKAIGNLYEGDGGDSSGWIFRINGDFTEVGCSEAKVKDGDSIEWIYSCLEDWEE